VKRLSALAAPILIALLAGCGSSSSSSSSTTPATSTPSTTAATQTSAATTVKTASIGKDGTVLVDAKGRTLYLFTPDTATTIACTGGCAAAWPPLASSAKAQAGGSAMSSQLGTVKRDDGTEQVTYAGHPLYTFAGDSAAGEAKGQGEDGKWWVVSASGKAVKTGGAGKSDDDSDSSSSSSSSGGY